MPLKPLKHTPVQHLQPSTMAAPPSVESRVPEKVNTTHNMRWLGHVKSEVMTGRIAEKSSKAVASRVILSSTERREVKPTILKKNLP